MIQNRIFLLENHHFKSEATFDSLTSRQTENGDSLENRHPKGLQKIFDLSNSQKTFWEFYPNEKQTISEVLQTLGIAHSFECGGKGRCGKCLIEVSTDSPRAEKLHFSSVLACQTQIVPDLILKIPTDFRSSHSFSQNHLVEPNNFHDFSHYSHCFNLQNGGETHFSRENELGVAIDLGTTTLCIALIDLSTKQVLCSASGRNPQIDFGRDIISRIDFATKKEGNLKRLQSLLIEEIVQIIRSLLRIYSLYLSKLYPNNSSLETPQAKTSNVYRDDISDFSTKGKQNNFSKKPFLDPIIENVDNETIDELLTKITKISVAGNTVMEYIFLGLDPSPMGKSPFIPPVQIFPEASAKELGFPFESSIFVFPIFGGYVGGDIVAGLSALEYCKNVLSCSDISLYLDIGTNGEMLLILPDKTQPILATATAAGPAFEGAEICFGMLGTQGAIESVDFSDSPYWQKEENGKIRTEKHKIDHQYSKSIDIHKIENNSNQRNLEQTEAKDYFRVIGDVSPQGICGSGLVDAIAELLRFQILLPNGRFQKKEELNKHFDLNTFPYSHIISFNGQPGFQFLTENSQINDISFDNQILNAEKKTSETGQTIRNGKQLKKSQQKTDKTGKTDKSNKRDSNFPVLITQKDVRQIQLAVGAIRTGIELLLTQSGQKTCDLQRIYLAGGFGNYLRCENILRIGLLPQEMSPHQIEYSGNMSLKGAIEILFNPQLKEIAFSLVNKSKTIDLATLPQFQEYFIRSMFFPDNLK
ncbi:MAG: ASKHA domain-containing protein [Planctomycetia bacterium]|nr:ASKHA domain-containing protein [Planctomycetia bacterium]